MFQVPLGRLSDRFGRKPPIILGLILMAPATARLGQAPVEPTVGRIDAHAQLLE